MFRQLIDVRLSSILFQQGLPSTWHSHDLPLDDCNRLFLREFQEKEVKAVLTKLKKLAAHYKEFPRSIIDCPYGLYKFSIDEQ